MEKNDITKNKTVLTEIVEICPHCDSENIYPNWEVEKHGYITRCQYCGKYIMLCDACQHTDDNIKGLCNWHDTIKDGQVVKTECFRGVIVEPQLML